MNHVRSSVALGGLNTNLRPIDCLDIPLSFNFVFGTDPTMIRISRRKAGTWANKDTEQLYLFCDIVKLQYIDTETYGTCNAKINAATKTSGY